MEMASLKVLESILPDHTIEDSKKSKKKKKKSKKLKLETLDKNKKRKKGQKRLTDDNDCSISFTQMPEKKKKKKKKRNDVKQNEEFPLLLKQCKKPNPSKQRKQFKGNILGVDKSFVHPGPGESMMPTSDESSTLKQKTQHKRKVMFNLLPEEILPKSHHFALTDIFQTQLPSTDKLPSLNSVLSGNGSHNKQAVEKNCVETQSTPEEINSQDLFITQKTFSDPYPDISSSLSTDETTAVPPYQNCKQYSSSSQEKPLCMQTAEASTQTENFFTSPGLANSLRFYHRRAESACFEEPMDLSLPNRSRQELGLCWLDSKSIEAQNHSELKITDVTSSDESDVLSKSKAVLPQLKVVQTRLNESFFFKLKGEGESPKPRSPLMMLTGSVDKKPKK